MRQGHAQIKGTTGAVDRPFFMVVARTLRVIPATESRTQKPNERLGVTRALYENNGYTDSLSIRYV